MKKAIAIMVLAGITAISSYGQDLLRGSCGTHDHTQIFERLEANKKSLNELGTRNDTKYLPIKFHRVGDNQGEMQIKVTSILDMMCRLKREMKQADFVPYIFEQFNDIENDGIFFNPNGNEGQIVANKDPDALDIFITENANTSGGQGTVLGYYSPSGDYVIARKKEIVDSTGTLAHEIGHFLSLPHTFFGWEGIPYSEEIHGNPITLNTIGFGTEIELVSRDENCEVAADRLCDTPPDYNFPFAAVQTDTDQTNNIASSCDLFADIRDKQNRLIDPMENNIMSYFDGCQEYYFTQDQIDLMDADFNSSERSHLRSDYVPNLNEITEVPEIIGPGSSVDSYNAVLFEWDPVEHADYYVIEITSNDEFHSYVTSDTKKFVTDLSPNTVYFWLIAPFNETSTCLKSDQKVLSTGSDLSDVEGIEEIAEIHVYPNPINSGEDLSIEINSTKRFEAQLSIIGIDGKVLSRTNNIEIKNSNNALSIPTTDLESGMYILQLVSSEGTFNKQIIIN